MYRFLLRPKWVVFHVAIVALIVGMMSAAAWQFSKYQARNDFKAVVAERKTAEPEPLIGLLQQNLQPSDIEWRRLTASGSYVPGRQLREINVSLAGKVGVNVLTPFQIDNGPIVLVNRGFTVDEQAIPEAPSGNVIIGGTARTSRQRRTGELSDNGSTDNDEVRRIDLAVIEQRLGTAVAPIYLDLIASKPPQDDTLAPIPPPDLGSGPPHLSYTFQWIIFSLCAAGGWVFAVRKSARNRLDAPTALDAPERPSVETAR